MEILKDLFDKRIMSILNLFIKNPEKEFYLSEVSRLVKINISTTFRILNKLVEKNYIKANLIGKVKVFKFEKNEKTFALTKFLQKDDKDPVQEFIEAIKNQARLSKIIIESRTNNYAKFFHYNPLKYFSATRFNSKLFALLIFSLLKRDLF